MIYKFRIISDENELFTRTIEISDDDTFLKFHKAILKACDFKDSEMTSFFISNDDWDKGQEITLFDMGEEDTGTIPMQKAKLKDFVGEKEDKIIYQFDFFGDRALFCTLVDILEKDAKKKYPVCSHSTGNAPLQVLDDGGEDFNDLFNETGIDDEDDLFSNEDKDELGFGDEFGGNEFDDFGGGGYGNDYDY
ncbi:MAG: plasmid pRiA4b ORF-3 family protein [Bacteroidales bacterium]|nr:plasmid pRiA4b ORF-3 family protein [Bacteroidales bacterium]